MEKGPVERDITVLTSQESSQEIKERISTSVIL